MLDQLRQRESLADNAVSNVGTLIGWQKHRGFGFLTNGSDPDLFVHYSAFAEAGLVPKIGETYIFDLIPDRGGRHQAANLRLPQ